MTDGSGSHPWSGVTATWLDRVRGAVFGDRVGEAIFLGAVVFFGLTWKIAPFVAEAGTAADALAAVADGHLRVEHLVHGSESELHVVDGDRYAGDYGHVLLSLPFLWLLAAASAVVDPGIVLFTGWTIAFAGFAVVLGDLLDRRHTAVRAGGVAAVALWAGNLAVVRPLGEGALPLVALQLTTMLAGALLAVTTYRLVRRATDRSGGVTDRSGGATDRSDGETDRSGGTTGRTVGATAGAAVVLATPVAFWATIPASHTLIALLAVATLFAFFRTRAADDRTTATRFRALTYALAGLAIWIDAAEGIVLLAAVAVTEAAATREIAPREVGVACGALLLSLMPFAATNVPITGTPIETPAMRAAAGPVDATLLGGIVLSLQRVATAAGRAVLAAGAAATDPARVYEVFVRSEFSRTRAVPLRLGPVGLDLSGVPINLSAIESMPLLAALLAAPAALYRSWRTDGLAWPRLREDPARATDALAVLYLALLAMLHLPDLPAERAVTVRHLHPMFPLGIYALARFGFVREFLQREWRRLLKTYAAILVVGLPAFVYVVGATTVVPAQVARINAMAGIAVAGMVLYWGVLAALGEGYERLGVVALALAGAVTTAFLLLAPYAYFPGTERFAVPLARLVAEFVAF